MLAVANDAVYRQAPVLADVREGELAAVLRSGAVLRLNPYHLTGLAEHQPVKGPDMEQTPEPTPDSSSSAAKNPDLEPELEHAGNNPAAAGTPLTGARAGFATERGEAAQFQKGMIDIQAERRDEATRARVLASENRDAEQADRVFDAALANTAHQFADSVAATFARAERVISGFGAAIANRIEAAMEFLHDIVTPPPKLTAQQVHDTLQAHAGNLEKDNAQAVAAAVQDTEAARDWQTLALISAQQEKDLRLSQALGTNVTAEANLNRDPADRQREHDRERDYGREL
jgi:hypothetical protein